MADLTLFWDHLVRFQIHLWEVVDSRLQQECGIQLTGFEVIRLLGRDGPSRIQDIATEFGITTGGASKAVDRIESAGHCRRTANPADRRSSLIELTDEGLAVLERSRTVFEAELQQRIGAVLTGADIEQLTRALAKLRTHHP